MANRELQLVRSFSNLPQAIYKVSTKLLSSLEYDEKKPYFLSRAEFSSFALDQIGAYDLLSASSPVDYEGFFATKKEAEQALTIHYLRSVISELNKTFVETAKFQKGKLDDIYHWLETVTDISNP